MHFFYRMLTPYFVVNFRERLKDARGEPKVEVLSSDVIASRLKQVLARVVLFCL
jgi:hypothetical protein